MKKFIILLVALVVALPCYAQKIVAEKVSGDVVLKDLGSGKKWQAKKGAKVGNNWDVISVSSQYVVIEKSDDGDKKVRGVLPVRSPQKVIVK